MGLQITKCLTKLPLRLTQHIQCGLHACSVKRQIVINQGNTINYWAKLRLGSIHDWL
ncbi:MAG: hypothetical protein FFODKBPE_00290 [Candidatus Argoarchaeum ethanivorans]|uniref:Uncharacterized protein n=1 Tax=Candidatus Argoarchaeum ethanivorans TaxID=2608793 RepID=A0A811T4X2_9EURY|nr:MAG: hypothetical protein FFODKBPE_00290 [Candidatus Argoarchaeum ethanivorans]